MLKETVIHKVRHSNLVGQPKLMLGERLAILQTNSGLDLYLAQVVMMSRETALDLLRAPIKIPRVFNSVHDQSLYLATSKDKIEEAIFLLAQGANPNYIFPEPPRYSTLHKACYNNNSQLIKELLKHDVLNTINLKTINGYTPLHIACVFGHIQCIKLLLESCICNTGNFV